MEGSEGFLRMTFNVFSIQRFWDPNWDGKSIKSGSQNCVQDGTHLGNVFSQWILGTMSGWKSDQKASESVRLPLLHGLHSEDDLSDGLLGVGIVFPEVTTSTARHFLKVKLNMEVEGETLDDADYELIEQREEEQ